MGETSQRDERKLAVTVKDTHSTRPKIFELRVVHANESRPNAFV